MDSEMLNEKKRNREEKPEALASPENVSKKKKKKKKRKMKENEAETEQQNQQPSQVCPKPLVVATRISVEETPKKKKMKKKKSNLIGEQQELNKNKEEENGEVPNETNALAIEVPTNVEMKTEGQNQYPSQVCPQPLVVSISVEANLVDPKDTPKKKRGKKKKNKNKSDLNGEQQELNKNKEEENGEVPNETNALAIEVPTNVEMKTEGQNQYPSQVCPQPLVVSISVEANLVDPKDTPKKKRGKKKKNKNKSDLNGEQQELNKDEVPNETNPPKPSLAFDKSQTEPRSPIRVSLIPQTSTLQPTIPIETEQNLSKSEKKRKNKKMRVMLDDGVQPNEHNIETPVQSRMSICHTPTPTINHTMDPQPVIPICPKQCFPIEQTIAVDPAISMDEPAPQIGQTIPMNRNQRKRMNKKKKNKMLNGAQPNGHNIKQPETLVQSQTSICHTTTPPIYQTTDPDTAIPICPKPAALIDQTNSVVDSALSIGPEPAPLIGQTIPVDPALPIDTQQKLSMNNRKQRRMAKKSLLSEEQPNGHDPKSTAEAPVRETIGVTVTKDPRSQMCWACRKSDHKISQCRMLKSLSKHAKVCFFCGEIGHSLGRCSVSSAGGGRFAKCLLCHADGHFSYNCPGDGHGNYLKVVATNGPINRSYRRGYGMMGNDPLK